MSILSMCSAIYSLHQCTYFVYVHVHICLLCYIDHTVCMSMCMCMYVCPCVCTLIGSHQTLVVSASTLYESELQHSVGEAGIGYPAGGSSTHAHTCVHTHLSIIILVRVLSDGNLWKWGPAGYPLRGSKKQIGRRLHVEGHTWTYAHRDRYTLTSYAERHTRRRTATYMSALNTHKHTLHTVHRHTHKHSMLSHPALRSTAWPIISCLQSWLPRDEMS